MIEDRCRLAEQAGAVLCTAPDDEGLAAIVASLDELTSGRGADHVFLAAGGSSNAPVEIAAKLARDRARVVDIGNEHYSVGIIHRGATGAPARGAAAGGGARAGGAAAAGGGGGAAAGGGGGRGAAAVPCGERASTPPPAGGPSGISHDVQTEGYLIVSGAGTMVTGGHIVNGSKSAADAEVTTTLNGPSCSGAMVGADVVTREVKVGDIIIIPAGTPHGWSNIPDHVDYLSFRPSQNALTAGYVNPAIKK